MLVSILSLDIFYEIHYPAIDLAKLYSTSCSLFETNIRRNHYSLCSYLIPVWMACSWKSDSYCYHPADVKKIQIPFVNIY